MWNGPAVTPFRTLCFRPHVERTCRHAFPNTLLPAPCGTDLPSRLSEHSASGPMWNGPAVTPFRTLSFRPHVERTCRHAFPNTLPPAPCGTDLPSRLSEHSPSGPMWNGPAVTPFRTLSLRPHV